jgi:hypothetical protein
MNPKMLEAKCAYLLWLLFPSVDDVFPSYSPFSTGDGWLSVPLSKGGATVRTLLRLPCVAFALTVQTTWQLVAIPEVLSVTEHSLFRFASRSVFGFVLVLARSRVPYFSGYSTP